MGEVRWGIIGCGDVTERKSGPAFSAIEGSELVAVMRRDAAKAQDYARRHNVPKWHSDAQKLIDDPDVNAVYVATPPGSHAEYTIRAAQAGKPVYVEKPMALSEQQCREMIDACDKAGVKLFVAYYRRCMPSHVKVKELVESGVIGDIRFVTTRLFKSPVNRVLSPEDRSWRLNPEVSGGGYFVDLAPHQLDFFDYLFGPITSVSGHAANQAGLYAPEDIVAASYTFESGVVGVGMWCFTVAAACEIEVNEIVGSKGRILFETFGMNPIVVETDEDVEEYPIEPSPCVQQPLIQTVVDELLGKGKCPSTGETALRTTRVVERILSAYYPR